MTTVTRRYRFAASHRLHMAALSEEQNDALYGKCNNPFGHGHDYVLDVSARGALQPRTGKLFAFGDLDRLVENEIVNKWAFRNLNLDVPQFAELVPTTENFAQVIATVLADQWRHYMPSNTWLARIYIEETPRNTFEIRLRKPVDSGSAVTEEEAALQHV